MSTVPRSTPTAVATRRRGSLIVWFSASSHRSRTVFGAELVIVVICASFRPAPLRDAGEILAPGPERGAAEIARRASTNARASPGP
jgi:hypothetical protein